MTEYIRYFMEYAMIFVCAIYCYIPIKQHITISKKRLFISGLLILFIYCIICSAISMWCNITPNFIFIISIPIFFVLYYKVININIFKCLFLFFYLCSMMSYPYLYAIIFDALNNPNGNFAKLSYGSLLFQYVCLIVILSIYLKAKKHLIWIIDNITSKSIWYIYWTFPLFYTIVSIIIIPINYDNLLYRGRSAFLFPIIVTSILISEVMIIYLFYKTSYEVQKNIELNYKNQFLEISAQQYNTLSEHMKETRQIRHDFRQHLYTIDLLAKNNNLDDLKEYLSKYVSLYNETDFKYLCCNNSVNAIANYYNQQAIEHNIDIQWSLNLPETLSIKEPILCGMLGNLLENSIDGCMTITNGEKYIKVSCDMINNSILVLIVENTHNNIIRKTLNNKEFLSTKHNGTGIGLTSINAIVEKYNGTIHIDYNYNIFCVNIMLNL